MCEPPSSQEINTLHTALESRGINSRKSADIFGREFELPVNAEHKATVCNMRTLCSTGQPHMRTFWAATIGFFCTPKLLAMEDTAVPGSVMLAGIAVLFALLALLAQPLSFAFYRLENRLRKAERKADSGLLV